MRLKKKTGNKEGLEGQRGVTEKIDLSNLANKINKNYIFTKIRKKLREKKDKATDFTILII